jgi:peptide/nickel transport system substrate-binding protein
LNNATRSVFHRLLFACLLLPASFALPACEVISPAALLPGSPLPTPTLPPLARAVDVAEDAVIVAIPIDPPSFNAYLNDTGFEILAGELVYGALADIGPDGNYYPELAQELPTLANGGLSQNGLTVTWRLRPNLRWSDGEPFTANDVRFTWQSLHDSRIWAPGFNLIDKVETPDPLTAIIHYREFYPNYLIQFGGAGTGVFPAHHCGPTDQMLFWDCNLEPVSTGPFVLAQWIPGVRLTFTPNPHYYLPERPLASQLVLAIQADPELRSRNLIRGNAHLDLWPDGSPLTRMQDSGNVNIVRTRPARYVLRLVPNLSAPNSPNPETPHPILASKQVRQAIRYAVDPGQLNNEIFQGQGDVINSELYQFDCNLPPYEHNPGLAAALLDQAGWRFTTPDDVFRTCQACGTAPNGTPLTLKSYTYLEFGDQITAAHRLIEEMLANVGVKLEREAVEGSQLWNTWENEGIELHAQFDLDFWDDGYFGVDPTIYLTNYYDPRSIPTRNNPVAGLNVNRYRNPTLTRLFDALHTPLPVNRRRAILCEIALTLHDDVPQIPLLALPDMYAINPRLQGVIPHIYDTITWNAAEWQLAAPEN